MKKLNQKGFGLIEVILLATIIFATGAVGYYIYNKSLVNDETSKPQSSAETSNTNPDEYINKEFGFMFEYPKSPGSQKPTVSNTTEEIEPITGRSYYISVDFKFSGGFVTKDFALSPDKKDTMPLGFTQYDSCKAKPTDLNQVVLYQGKDVCVAVVASEELGPAMTKKSTVATMIVQKKLTKNKKIAGIEFARNPVVIKNTSNAALKSAYDYDQLNDKTIAFAKTIQEL
jgi:hypothetical protein